MDVSLRLLRLVLARAWIGLHLHRVDVGLDTCRVLGTSIGVDRMSVLARSRLLHGFSSETLVLARGPCRSLLLVLRRRLINVRPRHVAKALVVYEFGN